MLVICSLSRSDNGTRCHVRTGSASMWALVRTASGMGHWMRLIKILDGTDCYYCINNMTCPIRVYYRSVILVAILDIVSTIMLSVYLVTLPDTCTLHMVTHYSCTCILHIACIPVSYTHLTLPTIYSV